MSNAAHIAVCDDEEDLRETVAEYLERRGHRVTRTEAAAALAERLDADPTIDVVLLDINMPGQDGLSFLRNLPEDRGYAVIMLTAAGETIDKVIGLELGADDYLGKPVDLRELEARIRAVMRRGNRTATPEPQSNSRVTFDGLTLDFDGAKLYGRDGVEIPITAMELRLLRVFTENRGRVLNRDQLLELAHDRGWDPFDRSIDIRVSRLRRKIERVPEKPALIRTVRGVGYLFDPES